MKILLSKSILPLLGGVLFCNVTMAQKADLNNPGASQKSQAVEAQIFYSVSTPPVIDGVIDNKDSWSANQWKEQTSIKGTASGSTSKFQLTKDDQNIYLAVQVVDNTPHSEFSIANSYERDCVEAFFSMDPTSTSYASGVWQ
ncbi:MAG: sugar-binding protein, partial [Bacteroidota bacterium]|nr:sugar-binding protein [Bacteroidota bacterium]